MGGQQVQFTGLIAVYHEVLAEVPKRRTSAIENSADQPIMNQPVTFQVKRDLHAGTSYSSPTRCAIEDITVYISADLSTSM